MAFAANDLGHVAEHNRLLSVPLGTLGYAAATASQGSITTIVDMTGVTVTTTTAASRRVKITVGGQIQSTVASDRAQVFILYDGAQQQDYPMTLSSTAGGNLGFCFSAVVITTSGSHTFKAQVSRTAGTGTLTVNASASRPAWILVEDIGV